MTYQVDLTKTGRTDSSKVNAVNVTKMKHKLEVVVRGPAGSGKTAVLNIINAALLVAGLKVKLTQETVEELKDQGRLSVALSSTLPTITLVEKVTR